MNKVISGTKLSNTLHLSKCTDGVWLWDGTRQMNLSMRAKSTTDAFVEAIEYYQERLTKIEQEYADLKKKVDVFVAQFTEDSDDPF